MRWRFEIVDPVGNVTSMSEPEGFLSGIIGLERHPELHSLVKSFRSAFRAYGSNGTQDGLRDTLKTIETTYGPDSKVVINIDRATDNFAFSPWYSGEIAIKTFIEGLEFDHYLEFTPVQTDMWRTFMSRFDVPVNVQSAVNLDGAAVTVYPPENLLLPTQLIRHQFYGSVGSFATSIQTSEIGDYIQWSPDKLTLDEIKEKFSILSGVNPTLPVNIFTVEYGGEYRFVSQMSIHRAYDQGIPGDNLIYSDTYLELYLQINEYTPLPFSVVNSGILGYRGDIPTYEIRMSTWSIDETVTLLAGDKVRVYALIIAADGGLGTAIRFVSNDGRSNFGDVQLSSFIVGDPSWFNILADTEFTDSESEAILIHDLCAAVLDRITTGDKFYSELLGSPDTRSRTYADEGFYWNNAVLTGLLLRGYTLVEKQFALSFKDILGGINPHMNISIGYETVANEELIRLELREHCYDYSSMSVLLSGVQRIKRKYSDQYFNSVETGSTKGQIEDISGIDDPQKQTRAAIFKNLGRKLQILSTWITQSLTVEWVRRSTITKSADNKFDNDIFLIEVTQDGSDYTPRLNEDYDSVANLLNEATRYNKRWTPARMFLRWANYIFMGAQSYVGTVYRFVSGTGNYDMTSERKPDAAPDNYDAISLSEKADIEVTSNHLYIPIEFEIEHYLTVEEFDTIDANRNKAIGISQNYEAGSHKEFFITDLQLEVMTGQIKLTGFFKDPFSIETVPPGGQIFQGGRIFDATFDFSFE